MTPCRSTPRDVRDQSAGPGYTRHELGVAALLLSEFYLVTLLRVLRRRAKAWFWFYPIEEQTPRTGGFSVNILYGEKLVTRSTYAARGSIYG